MGKRELLEEIKRLYKEYDKRDFEIDEALLDYLDIKDLQKLKEKILFHKENLDDSQKEWLASLREEIFKE
ncbi:MAG: hypothetical protein GXO02_05245 [Epsilonproteobacteria bacterium]|nr:hypothetical protein [Campylobacterota bacterium]